MNKKIKVFFLLFVFTLVLSACTAKVENSTGDSVDAQDIQDEGVALTDAAATVVISDEGVTPQSVTVNAGESVNWVNATSRTIQIGSDDHPTHTKNQGLTGGEFVIELAAGESKAASVGTKVGTWKWHDHLKASVGGTVVVE